MNRSIALASLIAILPLPALADDCHDRIAAMYDGDALDPRIRPAHRNSNRVTDAEGAHLRTFQTIFQDPLHTVSGVEGGGLFALVIDTRSWTGPTLDGPWTEAPNQLPGDRMAHVDKLRREEQANLSATECPGTTEINGQTLEEIRFHTKTDPNPDMGGTWFGAHNTVFIDPDSQRVMIWQMTDFENSWSQGVSKEVQEITYDYDETISLTVPD